MLSALKGNLATAPTLVLFVYVSSGWDTSEETLTLGAADFLAEPFNLDELLSHAQRRRVGGWHRACPLSDNPAWYAMEVGTVKKILIVDDQSEVRELVEVTLRIGPYEILQASSGDEALTITRSERPDLVLLDVMMPNSSVDGFDVCRQIKSDPATRNISVVMITARGQEADLEIGRQAGADDYFTKPFSPLQLMNKVEEILG